MPNPSLAAHIIKPHGQAVQAHALPAASGRYEPLPPADDAPAECRESTSGGAHRQKLLAQIQSMKEQARVRARADNAGGAHGEKVLKQLTGGVVEAAAPMEKDIGTTAAAIAAELADIPAAEIEHAFAGLDDAAQTVFGEFMENVDHYAQSGATARAHDPHGDYSSLSPSLEAGHASGACVVFRSTAQLSDTQREISDGFAAKYFAEFMHDPEQNQHENLKSVIDDAAIAFSNVGCNSFEEADRMLQNVLRADAFTRVVGQGFFMIGAGYTLGMTTMIKKVMPHMPGHWSPALKGFLGGLYVSSIERIIASAVDATARNHLYGGGPARDVPALARVRPSLKRVALTSGAIAGTGTFIKNMMLRGTIPQAFTLPPLPDGRVVLNRSHAKNADLAADVSGSFFSGAIGRYISNGILNRHEAANFLAQKDLQGKLEKYSSPATWKSFGRSLAKDGLTFSKTLAKAASMPSTFQIAAYCALLMSALMSAHEYINQDSGSDIEHNEMTRLEAFKHAAASSGMMAVLVGGVVIIGILAAGDRTRNRIAGDLSRRFLGAPDPEPEAIRLEETRDTRSEA